MSSVSYETSKSVALKTILILGVITIVEVLIALTGKGYIISGLHFPPAIMHLVMVILSVYKAILIMYEFMHLRYEAPAFVKTILVPTVLLIWFVIALLNEGFYYSASRDSVKNPVKTEVLK